MGASVASHVVNGVHASTSSLEFNKTIGVKVAHVAVSQVHETFSSQLALWNGKCLSFSIGIFISANNFASTSLEGCFVGFLKVHERIWASGGASGVSAQVHERR